MLCLLLAAALCLSLCGCGKKEKEPEAEEAAPAAEQAIASAPAAKDNRHFHKQEITAENWDMFFEIYEVPLYTVTSSEVISQVCQNYCVVLRDEYVPYIRMDSAESVQFELSLDVYVDTLDIDTAHFTYRHTDDLLYATNTTKTAVFDRYALYKSAFGTNYSEHPGYRNAFFTGWAVIQPDSKVWAGFYVDLNTVKVLSASGTIELAN